MEPTTLPTPPVTLPADYERLSDLYALSSDEISVVRHGEWYDITVANVCIFTAKSAHELEIALGAIRATLNRVGLYATRKYVVQENQA